MTQVVWFGFDPSVLIGRECYGFIVPQPVFFFVCWAAK